MKASSFKANQKVRELIRYENYPCTSWMFLFSVIIGHILHDIIIVFVQTLGNIFCVSKTCSTIHCYTLLYTAIHCYTCTTSPWNLEGEAASVWLYVWPYCWPVTFGKILYEVLFYTKNLPFCVHKMNKLFGTVSLSFYIQVLSQMHLAWSQCAN